VGTSGFSDYQEFEFPIPQITGQGNLYLRFTGGDGYLLNIDRFVFGKDAIPLSGKLMKNIFVSDGALPGSWAVGYNFAVGSLIFGDRDFTVSSLSEELTGAEVLLTACSAKGTEGEAATLEAAQDITLYAAVDSRVENAPDWLSGWTKTALTFTSSNDVTFVIYSRDVSTGTKVSIGSNGQTYNCVNFMLLAQPSGTSAEVENDVNGDGEFNVADLVLVQKHILAVESLTPQQADRADAIADNIIDIFDMIALRQSLAAKMK
jgi:hypothetical protein